MHDVVVDNLVEEVATDESKVAVNGAERTFCKRPRCLREVRDERVGVV